MTFFSQARRTCGTTHFIRLCTILHATGFGLPPYFEDCCNHYTQEGKHCNHYTQEGRHCNHYTQEGKHCNHYTQEGKHCNHYTQEGKHCNHYTQEGAINI